MAAGAVPRGRAAASLGAPAAGDAGALAAGRCSWWGFAAASLVVLPGQRGERSERDGDAQQCAPRDASPPCGEAPRWRRRLWCVHGDRFPCQRTRLMTTKWETGRFVDSRSYDSVNPRAVIWFSRYRRPSSSALHHRTPQWVARKGADRTGGADRGGGPDQRRCHLHGPAASGTRILECSEFLCQGEYSLLQARSVPTITTSCRSALRPGPQGEHSKRQQYRAGQAKGEVQNCPGTGSVTCQDAASARSCASACSASCRDRAGAARLIGHDADCWKAQLELALGSSGK